MKTLILLLVSVFTFAQSDKENFIAFSGAVDARNLFLGSEPTNYKSGINYLLQFAMVSRNYEVNVGYESFSITQFSKFTIGFGYHIPLRFNIGSLLIKSTIIPSMEPTLINRWGNWGGGISYDQKSSHISVGGNLAYRINISDSIAIEYLFNVLPRVDLNAMYGDGSWDNRRSLNGIPLVGSNYFKLIYKLRI
ncbi:hypothetical protein SAMN05444143_102253 [Flavobacterium succinicans]|jgi:hypothetical protein|uniref:Outer membrane protein beta-barrel domain-containing protein n=1 Tax=Flavobacterium succinicans TaxID=29536 RepID=A0A1I4TSC9_9FLAO|nr:MULTISPECIES: hypothetical protein [Flavobacterium]OOV27537.1 hypothetical protein BXU11_08670 [Flavobacterium sp. LM5]SFM79571.1 hypothetical protein SAMN05444143_102253 [Flavobacterium succinicans]